MYPGPGAKRLGLTSHKRIPVFSKNKNCNGVDPEKQFEKKKTDNLITCWEERKESRKAEDDFGSSRKILYTAAVDLALQGFFFRGDGRL